MVRRHFFLKSHRKLILLIFIFFILTKTSCIQYNHSSILLSSKNKISLKNDPKFSRINLKSSSFEINNPELIDRDLKNSFSFPSLSSFFSLEILLSGRILIFDTNYEIYDEKWQYIKRCK